MLQKQDRIRTPRNPVILALTSHTAFKLKTGCRKKKTRGKKTRGNHDPTRTHVVGTTIVSTKNSGVHRLRSIPLINHENRLCGFRAAQVVTKKGGVIGSDFCRHPVSPLAPDIRKTLLACREDTVTGYGVIRPNRMRRRWISVNAVVSHPYSKPQECIVAQPWICRCNKLSESPPSNLANSIPGSGLGPNGLVLSSHVQSGDPSHQIRIHVCEDCFLLVDNGRPSDT